MINTYGLIGYPLSHSFSKKYFSEKFEKENITGCEYNAYPIEQIELLPQLINDNPSLKGLSVTIPYKESVLPFLYEIDETANKIGAVNCIKISQGKLTGYNTDAFGFRQSIKPFLESHHERALILGTGGASKAVHHVLKEIGINCCFLTRNKTAENQFTFDEVNENMMNAFKLIINATPLGMFPNIDSYPDIPYQFISSSHLLYDLVYNPTETEFLKRGKAKGAAIVNGYSMLQHQAEEAWRIWNK
jgi:shikimate dehydrogenase